MKGKMTIEVDEKKVSCKGSILFSDEVEPYLVLHSAAKCLGITTVEQFARLAVISTLHAATDGEVFEQTKILIPKKKENNNETDAH